MRRACAELCLGIKDSRERLSRALDGNSVKAIESHREALLSEFLGAQAQLGTGSPHLVVAFGRLLLVSSIRGSRYLLTLASASSRPLFPGGLLLLLRSSTAGPSAGSLSL